MFPRLRPLLANIGTLVVIAFAFVYLATRTTPASAPVVSIAQTEATTTIQTASVGSVSDGEPLPITTSTPITRSAIKKSPTVSAIPEPATAQTPSNQIARIQNPYPFPALSPTDINVQARGALVNILCSSKNGSLSPISGSGVIIDPKGVILTNAHVAQYVLLSQSPRIDLSCFIRTGSPASARWKAVVLYIPPVWVNAHAAEITTPHPIGTGEHDYGLLLITGSADGSPLPQSFSSLQCDTREAIGFTGDQALVASYPAEFLGGLAATSGLYPASSFTTIGKLLTLTANSVDAISLGGIIEAQSGSSGGATVNMWGRLIGLIVTTSEGQTTGERDLHALTLSYINRDLLAQSGLSLAAILKGDVVAEAQDFDAHVAPELIQLYIDQISPRH